MKFVIFCLVLLLTPKSEDDGPEYLASLGKTRFSSRGTVRRPKRRTDSLQSTLRKLDSIKDTTVEIKLILLERTRRFPPVSP
jgi:hypothetical protein